MTKEMQDHPIVLDYIVQQGMAGETSDGELMAELARATLAVPTVNRVQEDGSGFQPLVVRGRQLDRELLVAFTHAKHIGADVTARAGHCAHLPGAWLVKALTRDVGIVLFCGNEVCCEIGPDMLSAARQNLGL